jgi:DNA-directed RNA polymerase subunit L/DNA-directed RNA polymerase alpha subunit
MQNVFSNIQRPRPNTVTFQLSPTHVAYANTLRRLCIGHVETVGFRADMTDTGSTTDVEILANSTPMTNEMLADRIGLIPIHVKNPLAWTEKADNFTFVLNKQNMSEDFFDVEAADFKVFERRGEESVAIPSSEFFKPHPVTSNTTLIGVLKPLMPGGKPEEIHVKAKATVGTGRQNARFIPTTQCSYGYTRNTDPVALKAAFDDWVRKNKKIDPATLETDPARKAPLEREFSTLEINRCYLKDENGEPYSFDFTVESVGVLSPEYIVGRACEVGAELCKKYADPALGADVVVQRVDGRMLGYDFFFQRQDHTLGHLVQAWLDANMVGGGNVTFAGYDIPHPLRDEMVIRIGTADGEEATARQALTAAMSACASMFESWKSQWAQNALPRAGTVAPGTVGSASKPAPRRVVRRPTVAAA